MPSSAAMSSCPVTSATVGLVVTPTSAGAITNTASVSASTVDVNTTNNTAQVVTTVSEPAAPVTVSACKPNSGKRNKQLAVDVLGSGFQSGAQVSFGDSKIAVQNVTWVNAGDLAATIKIAGNAVRGPRTVTVTNPDGTRASLAACFTVQ